MVFNAVPSFGQADFSGGIRHRTIDAICLQRFESAGRYQVDGGETDFLDNLTKFFQRKKIVGPGANRMANVPFQRGQLHV